MRNIIEFSYKTETDSDIESKFMVIKGEKGRRINYEVGD